MPPVGATPFLPPPTDHIDTTSLDPRLIEDDFPDELLRHSAPVFPEAGEARERVRRILESKVARVASKICSVEEVTVLQKEVDHWLTEVTAADQVRVLSSSSNPSLTLSHPQSTALFLSSLLLKAILANQTAFSDASVSLMSKVDEVEFENGRFEVEVHRQKVEYSQKVRECQGLRTELSRLTSPAVSMASPAEAAHAGLSSSSGPSASPPSSSVTSSTSSPSYISNTVSPLSLLGLTRSASVAPTPPARSASIVPTSPSRTASTVPAHTSTPSSSSASHQSATSTVPTSRSRSTAAAAPIRKSRTMAMSQQEPPTSSPPTLHDGVQSVLRHAVTHDHRPSAATQSPMMEQAPAPRPSSLYSPNDGSSNASHSHSTETPFPAADAVIMADAFRRALRRPDFGDAAGDEF